MLAHVHLHRVFLWISVLAWGIGAGAQLFDLRVLVNAWSAAPPQSLVFLPYEPHFPVTTGEFFLPVSLTTLVGSIGALVTGWNTPSRYRVRLWSSAVLILSVLFFSMILLPPRSTLFPYTTLSRLVAAPAQS